MLQLQKGKLQKVVFGTNFEYGVGLVFYTKAVYCIS